MITLLLNSIFNNSKFVLHVFDQKKSCQAVDEKQQKVKVQLAYLFQ